MPRPTPARLAYLLIGLIIGGAALFVFVNFFDTNHVLTLGRSSAATPGPAQFTGATLVRDLPVNQISTKNGVELRLNTLEEYSDGFSITYSILTHQPGPFQPAVEPEAFVVTDDLESTYHLSSLGSLASAGPGLSTGYIAFTPALQPNAKALTVTVPHVLITSNHLTAGSPSVIDGPWTITVKLK